MQACLFRKIHEMKTVLSKETGDIFTIGSISVGKKCQGDVICMGFCSAVSWCAEAHMRGSLIFLTQRKSDCGWRETVILPKVLPFTGRFHKKFQVFNKTDMTENN